MKNIFTITLLLLTTACSIERSNQIDDEYDQIVPPNVNVDGQSSLSFDQLKERSRIAEQAKKNHGLMHVHRFGPGFDVLMTLDAGDSDVSFSMKLPQKDKGAMFSEDSSSEPNQASAQEVAVLDDKKAEIHHQELDERQAKTEEMKLQFFKTSMKHIFSAQSLFYKKKFIEALDETNKALALVPESAQAHALKGSIYYKMGLNPEAKASWQQALTIDPGMEQVNTSLARLNKEFDL